MGATQTDAQAAIFMLLPPLSGQPAQPPSPETPVLTAIVIVAVI